MVGGLRLMVATGVQAVDLRQHHVRRTAQHGENGIIEAIFATIGTRNRVCVDVGAFDLVSISNVYELWHDLGWRAVLIEANPNYCQQMSAQNDRGAVLTVVNAKVGWSGPTSLDVILHNVGGVPSDFDLLSVDVDGQDYYIWKHGLTGFRSRVVMIEYNPTIPPHIEALGKEENYIGASALSLLKLGNGMGYTLVAVTLTNLVFVVDEEASVFANVNNLPLLFDYSCVSYVMTSYDGGMFFSNKLVPYPFNLASREVRGKLVDEERFYIPDWLPT